LFHPICSHWPFLLKQSARWYYTADDPRRAKAISSLESDLLESAFDVGPMSRLACQVTVTQEMDGMEIRYPGMVDGRQLTRLLRPSTAAS
jgi:hypothetical protein